MARNLWLSLAIVLATTLTMASGKRSTELWRIKVDELNNAGVLRDVIGTTEGILGDLQLSRPIHSDHHPEEEYEEGRKAISSSTR